MIPSIGLKQALAVWSDLETALHGTNHYGENTAEIYIHRLMSHSPMLAAAKPGVLEAPGIVADMLREAVDEANETLFELLDHFHKTRSAVILVNGEPLSPRLKTARHIHRVHVKVTKKERA